jgi:O-antigen chain-terminating methyltransferase
VFDLDDVSVYIDRVTSAAMGEPSTGAPVVPAPPSIAAAPPLELEGQLGVLRAHAHIDGLPAKTRFRFFKRLLLRAARLFTRRQVAFNRAALEAFEKLSEENGRQAAEIATLRGHFQQLAAETAGQFSAAAGFRNDILTFRAETLNRLTNSHAALTSAQVGLEENQETVEQLDNQMAELRLKLFDLARERAGDRTELMMQHSRLEMLLSEARRPAPAAGQPDPLALAFTREMDAALSRLYARFENTFRGTREEISRRQEAYLDYVHSLKGGKVPVLDLGCGRGEWLELLRRHDIPAYGVDTNEPFVEQNRERHLDVRLEDGAAHLAALPESSMGAISAFHLIEHIDLPSLVRLIDGALRALVPGGVLILETPNPTNLVVGSAAFYLDPTHLKPLHPQFLEFLVQERGFGNVERRYLNPSPEPVFTVPRLDSEEQTAVMERMVDHLNWAFFGPQDTGVIGRKAGPA